MNENHQAPVRDTRNTWVAAPWGEAPTPLLPLWYRESHAGLPLPKIVQKANPGIRTVGEAHKFWEGSRQTLDTRELQALAGLAGKYLPPPDQIVVPKSIKFASFANLPLRNRTINCLQSGNLTNDYSSITVEQLMNLSGFGVLSLLDLWCVVEFVYKIQKPLDVIKGNGIPSGWSYEWNIAVSVLEKIFIAAQEFHGARTVKDVLTLDLYEIAKSLDIEMGVRSLALDMLTDNKSYAKAVVGKLKSVLDAMSPREQAIVKRRMTPAGGDTLEEVGKELNLTRERVRQIEKSVSNELSETADPELGIIAHFIDEKLEHVVSTDDFENTISEAFVDETDNIQIANIANHMLQDRLNYKKRGDAYLSCFARLNWSAFKDGVRIEADDVGIVDIDAAKDKHLNPKLLPFLPQAIDYAGIKYVMDYPVLRDTKKARAKIALIKIGRPASKEEIAKLSGIAPSRVGGQLSGIESVVRADKTRWGLAEWVDDIYEGIPAEIVQRINEDGGKTSIDRLLEELPDKFGVSRVSVKMYCEAVKFIVEDRNIRLRRDDDPYPFKEVISKANGVFKLGNKKASILFKVDQETLRGSGRNLHPTVGAILGIAVNEKLVFAISNNRTATITFPDTSIFGPTLGSIRTISEEQDTKQGDFMTLVFDRNNMSAEVRVTDVLKYDKGWDLITRLTGLDTDSGMQDLALALGCKQNQIKTTLRNRGEDIILDSLPRSEGDLALEEALKKLGQTLERL